MTGKNFFTLYCKECRKVLCSLTFLLYAAAVFAMYYSQFHAELNGPEVKPEPNQSSYGITVREIPELLMPRAIESLLWEYAANSYVAYPVGFYKQVRLTEKKRAQMADILCGLTGLSQEELNKFAKGETDDDEISFEIGGEDGIRETGDNSFVVDGSGDFGEKASRPEYEIPGNLTYECFREQMRAADDLIGGGSRYSDQYIVHNFSQMPKTYEEALEEYEQLVEEDGVTGGYARLYCDYVGMMLGILPVFVAVSLMQLDRRARMEALIHSRRASSAAVISARFAALVSVMFLPVIVTAVVAQVKVMGYYPGMQMDVFAFARYAVIWMLPSVMVTAAIGMVLTELAGGLVAILLQGGWWFLGIFSGALSGGIGKFCLTIRHNSLYKREIFMQQYGDFLFNRAFFTVLAIALVALAAVVYEEKRKGRRFGFYGLGKNRKNKLAA